jgi:bifunctional DNA-binding transcriptional regulator/antitoxin component of YhaV-PrlF toxin-antitoxin module
MNETRVQIDGTIRLPKSVAKLFGPTDKLAVWALGDTIVLKRVSPARVSSIARRAPERTMPLDEIVKEVRAYRRENRKRRGTSGSRAFSGRAFRRESWPPSSLSG